MRVQITNIRVVKEAMSEAAYLYAELVDMGAGMQLIDCGGGLGIDYDGSNTDTPASLAYTMQVWTSPACSCAGLTAGVLQHVLAATTLENLASYHLCLGSL